MEPPDGYTQEISGMIDGDEVVVTVSARFGGAVESVTWRGKEFINIYDHGRQISYAWQMDGHGECLNPTEPGSASDLFSPSSTSVLLEVCRPEANLLTTKVHPAFWLAPGETGFCDGETVEAVNEELVSEQILDKTIEIGYGGIENVIAFTAEITIPNDYSMLQLELPTGYLTYEFTNYWRINPQTGEMYQPESEELIEPWSFVHVSSEPPILATEDGEYAMGAYSADDLTSYEILFYDVPNPADRTNKWNIVFHETPAPAGVYTYQSFAIVGTLEQVAEAMQALFKLHPKDAKPPEGYVDAANCVVIEGWAWDPKAPNQAIDVEVRLVGENGDETSVYRMASNRYREDLAGALGDNGMHAFSIPTSEILQSGEETRIRLYGANTYPSLPPESLIPKEITLECPQYEPTETPEIVEEEQELIEEDMENSGSPSLPCAGGAFPLVIGALLWFGGRRKKQ